MKTKNIPTKEGLYLYTFPDGRKTQLVKIVNVGLDDTIDLRIQSGNFNLHLSYYAEGSWSERMILVPESVLTYILDDPDSEIVYSGRLDLEAALNDPIDFII